MNVKVERAGVQHKERCFSERSRKAIPDSIFAVGAKGWKKGE